MLDNSNWNNGIPAPRRIGMLSLRCIYCNSLWGGNGGMMQSQRFPSVFIHGTCRWRLHNKCDELGYPWNILIEELVTSYGDREKYEAMRVEAKERENESTQNDT